MEKLTDNEIIKADELVSRLHKYCFIYQTKMGESCGFTESDFEFLHNFVNHQKAEIELKTMDVESLTSERDALQEMVAEQKAKVEKLEKIEHFATKTIERQNAEIENLKKFCYDFSETLSDNYKKAELEKWEAVDKAKFEAYKEFGHLLIDKAENGVIHTMDIPDYVREVTEKTK